MFGKGRELRQLLDGFREMKESVDEAIKKIGDTVSIHSEQIAGHDKAIDRLEQIVSHCGEMTRSNKRELTLQKEQLDKLKLRVDKLIHDRDEIIWEDPSRAAFERKSIQRVASKEKLLEQALCVVNSDTNRKRLFNLISIKERTNKWLYNSEVKEKGNPPKNKYFKAIARIFASKIKVHILDIRLPLKNHGWHVDCKNMTFGKYIYTETWITYGIKWKKIIWKKRDPKTKELYALIQKKDNGMSYVSVVKKIDWLSEKYDFFG